MVRYLARMFPVVLRAQLGRDGRLVSRITRRVRLSELDPNGHMNQAVYAQVFEMGRADWVVRSRAWERWRDAGLHPVVAEQRIVYRRELRPMTRYAIESRAVGIEGRLLRFGQTLTVGDRMHARCECGLLFIGPHGVLTGEALAPHLDGLLAPP
ncbi:MAG: acyl-CoA thioesterase [Alphaproteobacteria bacterium]|nr:acyl-CoA thioesterase [Alphaproteobacteria bacterium]